MARKAKHGRYSDEVTTPNSTGINSRRERVEYDRNIPAGITCFRDRRGLATSWDTTEEMPGWVTRVKWADDLTWRC